MSITRVQYVSNASTGSGTTSLTTTIAAATAGNLLLALIATGSTASNGTTTTPSGFTAVLGPITNTSASPPPVNLYLFYKIATGGETSVVATNTVTSGVTCQVWEFSASGGWPASPVDVSASSANQAATTTPVTGTTATTAQGEELWIAGLSTNGGTQITYSAPTNGFTQETTAWAGASPFFSPNSAALYRIVSATGTASSGVTSSISKGFGGLVVAFKDNVAATNTRTVPASAALLATNSRSVPASVALLQTNTRTIPASGALIATNSRIVPTSAALLGTNTRTVPATTALLGTRTRTIPTGAALLATQTRQIVVTAALAGFVLLNPGAVTVSDTAAASVSIGDAVRQAVTIADVAAALVTISDKTAEVGSA